MLPRKKPPARTWPHQMALRRRLLRHPARTLLELLRARARARELTATWLREHPRHRRR